MTQFQSEEALVSAFLSALKETDVTFTSADVVREFAYDCGTTDVVGVTPDGEVWAFEAKLTKWRQCLYQAYRSTCFAHRAFVVLPVATGRRAARFTGEFDRRGIGICVVDTDGRVSILYDAIRREPIAPWLAAEAISAARAAQRT